MEALTIALTEVRGAYSLVLATKDQVIGVRDPNGFRPLCLGRLNGALVLASETCALDLVHAEYVRDVEPGEIVVLDENGLTSYKNLPPAPNKFCIFEFIYFARPDSLIFGHNVYQIRKRLGLALAKEHPVEADFAMPFPDSGNYAGLGYAQGLAFLSRWG